MATLFADTAYYLALLNPAMPFTARSVEQSHALSGPVLTTAWVVHELADGLSSPKSRAAFVGLPPGTWRPTNSTTMVEPDANRLDVAVSTG